MRHTAAETLGLGQAFHRVQRGQQLGGAVISGNLLALLSRRRPPRGYWLIENAAIGSIDCRGISFPHHIILRDCVLCGPTIFVDCDFTSTKGLVVEGCTHERELRVDGCTFLGRLILDSLVFSGNSTIQNSKFSEPPVFQAVASYGKLAFLGVRAGWQDQRRREHTSPREWCFRQCQFNGGLKIEVPPEPVAFSFAQCQFGQASATELLWQRGSTHVECRFVESLINGRIVLHRLGDEVNVFQRSNGTMVDFLRCVIGGEVDLRKIRLQWFNLEETSFDGGFLLTGMAGLSNRKKLWEYLLPLRWAAAQRCGVLLREQAYCRVGNLVVPTRWRIADLQRRQQGMSAMADDCGAIATEYENLKKAFARAPMTDREEEYCLYKASDYRRRHHLAEVGQSQFLVAAAILSLALVVALADFVLCSTAVTNLAFPVMALVAGLGGACVLGHRKAEAAPDANPEDCLGLLVLKWMVGYGVYLHRILVTAVLAIAAFALLFGVVIWAHTGTIEKDGRSILEYETCKCEAPSCYIQWRRVLYFSAVTFTTLGYGDYHPTGRAQLIAVAEALTGALLMALVVAVFTYKYLRR